MGIPKGSGDDMSAYYDVVTVAREIVVSNLSEGDRIFMEDFIDHAVSDHEAALRCATAMQDVVKRLEAMEGGHA